VQGRRFRRHGAFQEGNAPYGAKRIADCTSDHIGEGGGEVVAKVAAIDQGAGGGVGDGAGTADDDIPRQVIDLLRVSIDIVSLVTFQAKFLARSEVRNLRLWANSVLFRNC
jgi:hypothetical protein